MIFFLLLSLDPKLPPTFHPLEQHIFPDYCVTPICTHMHTQCIFPLQQVKGNHPRVHGALNELKTLARSMVVQSHTKGCLLEGLQEALAQFHRMAQNYRQVRLSF